MKITEFELYVMFVGCCSECSPAELRVQTALCAGRCAGRGAVRGGVGGQYGGHATCGRTAHTHSRHPSLGCLRVVTLSINCLLLLNRILDILYLQHCACASGNLYTLDPASLHV